MEVHISYAMQQLLTTLSNSRQATSEHKMPPVLTGNGIILLLSPSKNLRLNSCSSQGSVLEWSNVRRAAHTLTCPLLSTSVLSYTRRGLEQVPTTAVPQPSLRPGMYALQVNAPEKEARENPRRRKQAIWAGNSRAPSTHIKVQQEGAQAVAGHSTLDLVPRGRKNMEEGQRGAFQSCAPQSELHPQECGHHLETLSRIQGPSRDLGCQNLQATPSIFNLKYAQEHEVPFV